MALEHYYMVFDRDEVAPLLCRTWKGLLRRHPWKDERHEVFGSVEEFLTFAVDPEPEPTALKRILANETVRWTMERATPQYYFLISVMAHAGIRSRTIWPKRFEETAGLLAVSVDAFLRSKIDRRTMLSVLALHYAGDAEAWLELSEGELDVLWDLLDLSKSGKPIFRWQAEDCCTDGYRSLPTKDTKRFFALVQQAWEGNWLAPRLKSQVKRCLSLAAKDTPRFRDFDLSRQLMQCIRPRWADDPCVLRYVG
jgi:hypothetical protein